MKTKFVTLSFLIMGGFVFQSLAHFEDEYYDELEESHELGSDSRLRQQQYRFSRMVAQLINHATLLGYEITLGDAYRDPRVHGEYGEKLSYSDAASDHKLRLAIDINLFFDGQYLNDTKDHIPLGKYWESLGGQWGGHRGDGNHYAYPFIKNR